MFIRPMWGGGLSSLHEDHVSLWNMNDATNQTRLDSVGTNDLLDSGTTAWTAGKLNGAGLFVAADGDKLEKISPSTSIYGGSKDFTVSAWINTNYTGVNQTILTCATAVSDGDYQLSLAGASHKLRWGVGSDTGSDGSATADTFGALTTKKDTWIFVIADYTTATKRPTIMCNNGAKDTFVDLTGTELSAGGTFIIGGEFSGIFNHWRGKIDQVSFWNKILSDAERTTLWNGGDGLAYTDW